MASLTKLAFRAPLTDLSAVWPSPTYFPASPVIECSPYNYLVVEFNAQPLCTGVPYFMGAMVLEVFHYSDPPIVAGYLISDPTRALVTGPAAVISGVYHIDVNFAYFGMAYSTAPGVFLSSFTVYGGIN